MNAFKFFKKNEVPPFKLDRETNQNYFLGLDMDYYLIHVIRHKIDRNLQLRGNQTCLSIFNMDLQNLWLKINVVRNWGSHNLTMVDIDYQIIELNNSDSIHFTYRSELSELSNRLLYDRI